MSNVCDLTGVTEYISVFHKLRTFAIALADAQQKASQ